MHYLVCCDLRGTQANYKSLAKSLHNLGAQKLLDSVWILKHQKNAERRIFNFISESVSADDSLLVVPIITDVPRGVPHQKLEASSMLVPGNYGSS